VGPLRGAHLCLLREVIMRRNKYYLNTLHPPSSFTAPSPALSSCPIPNSCPSQS